MTKHYLIQRQIQENKTKEEAFFLRDPLDDRVMQREDVDIYYDPALTVLAYYNYIM